MAKQSLRVFCLFQWLRDRKVETGLTRKPKKDEEEEHHKIYRAMNRMVKLLIIGLILSACGPSKEKQMEEWRQKQDAIAKHNADSVVARLDWIISACKRGATEQEAARIYDSACVEANKIFSPLDNLPITTN